MEKSNKWVRFTQMIAYYPVYWVTGKIFIRKKLCHDRLRQNNSQVLLIANHISLLDAFLVIAQFNFSEIRIITPIRTITANKFLNSRTYGFALRWLGCFPAKKEQGNRYGLNGAISFAQEGSSLFFFPEGGRTTKGLSSKLHSGAAVVANGIHIPVIPVYIERRSLFDFRVARGKEFDSMGMNISEMMDKVWELKAHLKKV